MRGKSLFLLIAPALAACGNADVLTTDDGVGVVPDANRHVVESTTVGEERLELVEVASDENGPSWLLSSSRPAGMASSALDRLEAQAGLQLTPLETLLAMNPDAQADEALLADHEARARLLGRDDLSVRRMTLEPASVVDKLSPEQCNNLVLGGQTFATIARNSITNIDSCTRLQPQGSCQMLETSRHRVGLCPNGGGAIASVEAQPRGGRVLRASANVPDNDWKSWTYNPPLNFPLTGFVPSRFQLEATAAFGATFHARLAPN